MVPACRARFVGGRLAEEIVAVSGGETGMRIGATDHPELVGIYAKLFFQLKTVLERGARVFELEHLRPLALAHVEVAFVPTLEIRELVVRGQEWVRFTIALHLGHFVE